MREIKFRAWLERTDGTGYMIGAEDVNRCWPEVLDDGSVMQFTGLQDINGVDIYEGDIVWIRKDRFGLWRQEVWSIVYGYFGDAAFYVQNNINSGRLIEVDQQHPHFSPDGTLEIPLEVTGNIHQNPELLQ
jgi:uncharacterized phage protein (TIGR01671 family)